MVKAKRQDRKAKTFLQILLPIIWNSQIIGQKMNREIKISLQRLRILLRRPLYLIIYNTITFHGGKGITIFSNGQIS